MMKHICASLMLTLFALTYSAQSQNGIFKFSLGQSPSLSRNGTSLLPMGLDADAPTSSSSNPCAGKYEGTATDLPTVVGIRSNFGSVVLDASTVNYKLTVDTIIPGTTSSVHWLIEPIDYTKPASARIVFTDMKGNSSSLSFNYTPVILSVPQSMSVDSLTPKKSYTIRVPLTNSTNAPIQVRNIRLVDGKTGFTFGVQPPTVLVIQPNTTEYIILRFTGDQPKQYSDELRLNVSCNDVTEQRIPLTARIGSVAIKIESIDFGVQDTGKTVTRNLTATNTGTSEASLSQLILKDGNKGFKLKNILTFPIVLKAGQSMTIADVDFTPTTNIPTMDNIGYDVVEDELGTLYDPEVKGNGRILLSVENESNSAFALLPNPAREEVHVSIGEESGTVYMIELLDSKGAVVHSENVGGAMSGASFTLPLQDVPDGLYFCKLTFSKGTVVKRVMVLH